MFVPLGQGPVIIWTFFCSGTFGRNQFGESPQLQNLPDQNFLKAERTPNISPLSLSDLKDQRKLTNTIKILSGFFIVTNVINIFLQCGVHYLYRIVLEGDFSEMTKEEVVSSELRLNTAVALLNSLDIILMVCMAIVFSMWLYRNNQNARALGATNLTFGPKLTIFSYVIPFVSLWWPYRAMKEIWVAGIHLLQNTKPRSDSILNWWWVFWILSISLNQISFRLSFKINDETALNYLQDLALLDIVCSFFSICLNIFLILMVKQIYTMLRDGQIIRSKTDSMVPQL
jgi:hypothetical protein